MTRRATIEMLEMAAHALGELREEVVLVGGAIVALLVTDPAAPEVSSTKDLDIVVSITSLAGYEGLRRRLRELGFVEDTREGAPICRFVERERGLVVDVMPTDPRILGFANRWFPLAHATADSHPLPSGRRLWIASAPCFLATKLEAFDSRGEGDWTGSKDVEDLLAVIHGREAVVREVEASSEAVRIYLAQRAGLLLASVDFLRSIEGHLPGEDAGVVIERLRGMAALT